MPEIRAVVFDFFGTLSHAAPRGPGHSAVATRLGCAEADLAAALDRTFYLRASGWFGSDAATLRWICAELGLRPTAEEFRAARIARIAALRADITLRRDAVAVLAGLRARDIRTAVVSDCCYELPVIMPSLPVDPLLDARVYSVDVGVCKPDPAMYLTACARLGVAPEECLYVGDGGSQELTGAAAVGMTAVRLTAPDLDDHLVFNHDRGWIGPAAPSLTEAVAFLDRTPVLV